VVPSHLSFQEIWEQKEGVLVNLGGGGIPLASLRLEAKETYWGLSPVQGGAVD